MKKAVLSLLAFMILSSCGQPISSIKEPTLTNTIAPFTPTPSQTPTPSHTVIPTEWIKTYPTKRALLIYGTYWRTEYTINFIEWGDFYLEPYLILYEDGQLILTNALLEKQLSQEDADQVISELEQFGFSQLQAAYEADPDLLFAKSADMVFNPSSPNIHITLDQKDPKSIIYQKYREEHLIQPMKDILSYLNSFSSEGATLYQPDRLLVAFVGEESKRIPEDAIIIPWPEGVTSPAHRSYMGILYLEGAEALRLYKTAGEDLYEYFSFEGKNYNVYLRPILPHECHIYHLHEFKIFSEQAQPYFTCDNW